MKIQWINSKYKIIAIAICVFTTLLMLISFDYLDTNSFIVWSCNVWDVIFHKGGLREFYAYSAQNLRNAYHPVYKGSFLPVLPLALWNFPVWLTHPLGVETATFFSIIWYKLGLIAVTVISAIYISKICKQLGCDKEKSFWAGILFYASVEIYLSTLYAGQDEIVYMCLGIISMYCYLIGKRKSFVLCSSLAIIMCPIMLVYYLFLLIVQEKNVIKLMGYVVIPFIPSVIFELIYGKDAVYLEAKDSMMEWIAGLLPTSDLFHNGMQFSYFMVGYIVICLLGYLKISFDNQEEKSKYQVVWYMALISIIYAFTADDLFYRWCFYLPYVLILVMISTQDEQLNLILYSMLTIGRGLLVVCLPVKNILAAAFMMFQSPFIQFMLRHFGAENIERESGLYLRFIDAHNLHEINTVLGSLVVAAGLVLIVVNSTFVPKIKLVEIEIKREYLFLLNVVAMPCILFGFFVLQFR